MKKNLFPSVCWLVPAILFLWSCSGAGKKENNTTPESDASETGIAESVDLIAPTAFLNAEGIGQIGLGMTCDSLPEKVPGLYDLIIPAENDETVIYRFMLDGHEMFYGYDFNDGKIDMLSLAPMGVQASTANGPIGVGDPFLSLLNIPGMKAEWIASDDAEVWFWTAGGLWFGVEPDSASITLAEKLSSPERPPMASDFSENDLIGYIGTGIPF